MKIELRRDSEAESSGLEVSTMDFDINKKAKLFHMLSSTLYSDKISSIIRELSSNAHDSHVMAGKTEVPFQLTAPTYDNMFFEIRDYGVGLTAKKAEATILCYLGSDKDDNDDMIGGWGIGSKSPFAYTNTYEVLVYKDGQFAHFTCWKDDNGLPNKAIIDSGDTEEPNGVKMRVPVEIADVNMFGSHLRSYMDWTNYTVALDIGGNAYEKRECVAEKDFNQYRVKIYRRGTGLRKIVYGGFSYDMSTCVDNKYDYASSWGRITSKLNSGYDVAFIIDTPNLVSFNMNREVLEQTERSRTFVKRIVDEFAEIANAREKIVSSLSDTWLSSTNQTNTLVELNAAIDKINEEISKQDKTFDTIFRSSELKMSYEFTGTARKLSRLGVHDLRRLSIELCPIEDQIMVAYSSRAKPGPSDRSNFVFGNKKDNKTIVYVKAKTEDEAKKIIEASPDFAGFDLSLIDFEEVPITKTARSAGNRSRRSSGVPVIWCTHQNKRIGWKPDHKYVMVDESPDTVIAALSPVEKRYAKDHNVVFIRPTEKTKTYVDDADNLITLDEFEELANQWLYKEADIYVPRQEHFRLQRFFWNHTCTVSTLKKEYDELERQFSYDLSSRMEYAINEDEDFAKVFLAKVKGSSYIRRLKKQLTGVIIKQKKLAKISKFIDLSVLKSLDTPEANSVKAHLQSMGFVF